MTTTMSRRNALAGTAAFVAAAALPASVAAGPALVAPTEQQAAYDLLVASLYGALRVTPEDERERFLATLRILIDVI